MDDFLKIIPGISLESVESSNDYIKDQDFGSWVIAREQTKGRGRNNKAWFSFGEHKIIFSARVKIPDKAIALPLLSSSIALAVHRFFRTYFPQAVSGVCIKWPNDLLKNGKKIAGILIEPEIKPDYNDVVIGIGINLYAEKIPAEIIDIADCLLDKPPAIPNPGEKLATTINDMLVAIRDGKQKEIIAEINSVSCLNGREIAFTDKQFTTGIVRETAADGFLLVETDSGIIQLTDSPQDMKVL